MCSRCIGFASLLYIVWCYIAVDPLLGAGSWYIVWGFIVGPWYAMWPVTLSYIDLPNQYGTLYIVWCYIAVDPLLGAGPWYIAKGYIVGSITMYIGRVYSMGFIACCPIAWGYSIGFYSMGFIAWGL